jgi:hypothetical protein
MNSWTCVAIAVAATFGIFGGAHILYYGILEPLAAWLTGRKS